MTTFLADPFAVAVLAFVTVQRAAELVLARRNTQRLLQRGGYEVAPGHYPAIVGLHTAWLASLWWFASSRQPDMAWLAVYALLQAGRLWVLLTLGERWTTRIIVVPGAPLVTTGPYRFVSHPNYVIVACEIAVLPLAFGLVWHAAIFSLANAAVLAVRLAAENAALRGGQSALTAVRREQAGR